MYSLKYKMVFIHISRTAETSMTYALKDFSSDFKYPAERKHSRQHLDYREYKNYLYSTHKEDIKDYYVFTIIRNPWEKLVSHFMWHTEGTDS